MTILLMDKTCYKLGGWIGINPVISTKQQHTTKTHGKMILDFIAGQDDT